MAKRILTQHQYDEWLKKHQEAQFSVENVDKKIRDSYSNLECNLTLLGATGKYHKQYQNIFKNILSL